jgi:hypothetical protein
MNKFLAICLPAFIAMGAAAQTYHPLVDSGKTWSTVHHYYPGTTPFSDYVKFQGDTLINGLTYKKVWKSMDESQAAWAANGFIREAGGGQVFYMTWAGGSPNNLIYDFGAAAGDTVFLFDDPMGAYFVVDSVGTATLLTGELRKRLNLSCFMAGGGPLGQETWIEGMGSLYGVLQSGSCILIGDNPQLLCFREQDTLKYFNPGYSTCFVVTGTEESRSGPAPVEVFPNPADNVINIRVKSPVILPLKAVFRDPVGKVILESQLVERQTAIDLTGLSFPRVVLYTITGGDGFVGAGKIIVLTGLPSR